MKSQNLCDVLEELYPENRWDKLKFWIDSTFITPIIDKLDDWWWCRR